jgi:tRNA(fMet)-specific endonuclease VapC
MLVLDTDHLSLLDRESGTSARQLSARLSAAAAEGIATTIVNFEEQMRGWLAYVARARTVRQQIETYRRLALHLRRYRRISVLDFDEQSAVVFQRIRKLHPRLGSMDLKIAAIALANNAVLLSRNVSDFGTISDPRVEDWTRP